MEFSGRLFGSSLNLWEGWSWLEPAGPCPRSGLPRRPVLPLSTRGPARLPTTVQTPVQPQEVICNRFAASSFSVKARSPDLQHRSGWVVHTCWSCEGCARKSWAPFLSLGFSFMLRRGIYSPFLVSTVWGDDKQNFQIFHIQIVLSYVTNYFPVSVISILLCSW